MPTTLAIVIVSFNTRDAIGDCLASLAAAPPRRPHRVVVVDNGSRDDTVAAVRARWPDVHVIELGRNAGFAAATNAGVRASAGDLVLLLNSDTIVPPGSVDRLVAALEADPAAVAAGPRLVDAGGRVELSFGRMITPWNELRQKLRGIAVDRGLPAARGWLDRWTTRAHHPDWVSGACLLVRRAAGDAAGWLDERFFLYAEDVDFCATLRAGGGRVLFTPAAEVIHARGRSGATDRPATSAAYRRSQLAFYAKHHPRWSVALRVYLRARGHLPSG